MLPPPPKSTLFPYTTLFRSEIWSARRNGRISRGRRRAEPRFRKVDERCPSRRRSEEHTSELQSRGHLVCRLLLEKKKKQKVHSKLRQNVDSLIVSVLLQQCA